jgi:hypothetical protein
MSEQLAALRSFIDLLSLLHEAQERGLSSATIERLHRTLIDLEAHLEDLEDEFDGRRAEAELEAERDHPSRKPPL